MDFRKLYVVKYTFVNKLKIFDASTKSHQQYYIIKFSLKLSQNGACVNLVQANPSYTHGDVSHAARRNMNVRPLGSSARLMGIYSGKLLVAITECQLG